MPSRLKYQRILLKLSGEALSGRSGYGIDAEITHNVTKEIASLSAQGVQVSVVIGAGNIFRGSSASGIERVTADQMGMMATIINGLALQDGLEKLGLNARLMSAIRVNEVCEIYIRRRAIRHLDKNRIVVFCAGTGNPFFTTDTAASLRSVEINADLLIKATKVDGVYSGDPLKDKKAVRYATLGYDEIIEKKIAVMDTTAVVLCRENNMPIRVLDMGISGALSRAAEGVDEGTLVS